MDNGGCAISGMLLSYEANMLCDVGIFQTEGHKQ
jgi:hypothetical protein